MELEHLKRVLVDLPIGDIRYFASIDSTNTEALRWAEAGAPDLALVVANEQTQGRGRAGRRWFTPPNSALALSLVLRSPAPKLFFRLTALGTLAICQALHQDLGLTCQVKWPNDVLLAGRKVAGVLVEAAWRGDYAEAIVIGMGLNLSPAAVPPDAAILFPATCVEAESGRPVDRLALLHSILESTLAWREQLDTPHFLQTWEEQLAWRGEWVQILSNGETEKPAQIYEGTLLGLDADGAIRLRQADGRIKIIHIGESRLRKLPGNQ